MPLPFSFFARLIRFLTWTVSTFVHYQWQYQIIIAEYLAAIQTSKVANIVDLFNRSFRQWVQLTERDLVQHVTANELILFSKPGLRPSFFSAGYMLPLFPSVTAMLTRLNYYYVAAIFICFYIFIFIGIIFLL